MTTTKTLEQAIDEELAAWKAIKDRMPGTENFDVVLWERWKAAAVLTHQIRDSQGRPSDGKLDRRRP